MKKGNKAIADALLIGAIIIIALVAFALLRLFTPAGRVAVISSEEGEIMRLPLSEDTEIKLGSGHTVAVRDGTVDVTYAPCPEKICEDHSPISLVGESIICLPEKISITVVEEGE